MTKEEFMRSLGSHLKSLSAKERADMLYDYEEHLRVAMEQGLPEEEAVASLGSPGVIAKELLADCEVPEADKDTSVRNVSRAVLATIALGLFNFIVVLGPVLGIFGILVGMYCTSVALVIGPLVAAIGLAFAGAGTAFLNVFAPLASLWTGTAVFPLLLAVGLGLLLLAFTLWVTKWLVRGLVAYVNWNVSIIKGGR